MIIELLFNRQMKKQVLDGAKTCTSRFEAKGVPGDRFVTGDKMFELVSVEAMRLRDVASNLFKEEGFASPEDFIRGWNEIYCTWKTKIYDPEKIVIVHQFGEV